FRLVGQAISARDDHATPRAHALGDLHLIAFTYADLNLLLMGSSILPDNHDAGPTLVGVHYRRCGDDDCVLDALGHHADRGSHARAEFMVMVGHAHPNLDSGAVGINPGADQDYFSLDRGG